MVMNGFDTNFDGSNEVYAVNTVGFHYVDEPMRVKRDELVRIYLVNVLEFDPLNSFHVHANFFHYFPTGTSLRADRVHRHGDPGPGPARDPRAALPVPRPLHVPRPRDRVRRARLDRLLRGRADGGARATTARAALGARLPAWLLGARCRCWPDRGRDRRSSPRSAGPGSASAPGRRSRSSAVERTVLRPGEIELTRAQRRPRPGRDRPGRGQRRLRAVHAPTAGARSAGSARRTLDDRLPVDRGRGLQISILTSTGGTIEHEIPVAAETPEADVGFFGLMALLGLYVGVIPVASGCSGCRSCAGSAPAGCGR